MHSGPMLTGSVHSIHGKADALHVHSRSLRNVSSTDGSGSTMSGSLSMLRPSRLRGSMRSSSSSGKTPSESKHSGTVDRALLMSFDRLGLESSDRKTQMMPGEWKRAISVHTFTTVLFQKHI